MRQRWLGATGRRVPEICVEGEVELPADALVVDDVSDTSSLHAAHVEGRAVVVRCSTQEQVVAALARPEVACALVPAGRPELLELDLTALTYGP